MPAVLRIVGPLLLLNQVLASRPNEGAVELTPQVAFDKPKVITFGGAHPKDGSKKKSKKKPKPFKIDTHAVTNAQFAEFVKQTKFKTVAEDFNWSFVLEYLASPEVIKACDEGMGRVRDAQHWLAVEGATWKAPEGQGSSVDDRANYPVTHIAWTDANAYCKWAGRRLPTELEWEYAAKGGQKGPYPWGKEATAGKANLWQGKFPEENTKEDGYAGTAPVDAFEPNPYGLYNMVGNVWEWVSGGEDSARILRGGSYIDTLDGSHNHAATVSTRYTNSGDSSSGTLGFRCAADLSPEELGEEL